MERNIRSMIVLYNAQRVQYQTPENKHKTVIEYIDNDKKKISWTRALKHDLAKNKSLGFGEGEALISAYRPFTKRWMYYGRHLNEYVFQMPKIFPNAMAENRVICVTGIGASAGFSALMVEAISNFHTLDTGQCFPLKIYEESAIGDTDLFTDKSNSGYRQLDGISDSALAHFMSAYPGETINKEDLFYYLYGILHSDDYRTEYRNNLMKQLPRLPMVSNLADFRAFRDAGRTLADLHLGYESVEPYSVTINAGEGLPHNSTHDTLYRVVKMKYGKGKDGKENDLSQIIYNAYITLSDIPLEAYEYVVNGKSAIGWIMEWQGIETDKASGIVNDANHYANETMQNPAYPLELLQRVITVSIETMKVVRGLPPLRV